MPIALPKDTADTFGFLLDGDTETEGGNIMSKPLYQTQLEGIEDIRWVFAHIKRFLERATQQGKKLLVVAGYQRYEIENLEGLEQLARILRQIFIPWFNEGKKPTISVYYQ